MPSSVQEFSAREFTRALAARLVESGCTEIEPQKPSGRRGFEHVVRVLDQQISSRRNRTTAQRSWYKQLVRLKNALQASNSGAFDNFETALRDLQTSATDSPNPFYEYIAITISKPFAKSILSKLAPQQRALVLKASDEFLRGASAGR